MARKEKKKEKVKIDGDQALSNIVERTIEMKLTQQTIVQKMGQLTDFYNELHRLRDEMAVEMKGYKDRIKGEELKIEGIFGQLNEGIERKTLACELRKDYKLGVREYYYENELVDSEPFDDNDFQLSLVEQAEKGPVEEEKKEDQAGAETETGQSSESEEKE